MERSLLASQCTPRPTTGALVGDHKFEVRQLDEMKKECTKHCLSTCNYILGYCYDTRRVIKWTLRQAMHGFRGTTDTIQ